jgi:hypothetical protein
MIKFTLRAADGTPVVGLGLSEENWRRLRGGKPIVVKLRELLDSNIEILLIGGEDETAMTAQLAPFITPETVVHPRDGGG